MKNFSNSSREKRRKRNNWNILLRPTFVLSLSVTLCGAASNPADPPAPGDEPSSQGVAPRKDQIKPADRQQSEDIGDAKLAAINRVLSGYLADPQDLKARMLADKAALAQELVERRRAAFGGTGEIPVNQIPLFGGSGSLEWRVIHDQTGRLDAYAGPIEQFQVITSNKNHLGSLDRNLKRVANKLNNSKFACGQFDFAAEFKAMFNEQALSNYVTALQEGVLAAAPMAILANFSPTLYDCVRHLKAIAGVDLTNRLGDCRAMEQVLISAGHKALRGPGYAACMQSHRGAGLAAANRACNQGAPGPFDGVESVLGKIRSPFIGDQKGIDLIGEVTDKMRPASRGAMTEEIQAKQAEVQEAFNHLQTLTNPGDPQRTWGKTEWAAYNKYKKAEVRHKTLTEELNNLTKAANENMSRVDWVQDAMVDAIKGVMGSVVVTPSLDVQIGKTPRVQIRLVLDHAKYLWVDDMKEALEDHWNLLSLYLSDGQSPPQQDDLDESRNTLRAHFWECTQTNWDPYTKTHFNELTYDRLAALWAEYLESGGYANLKLRLDLEATRRIREFLALCGEYEVYTYAIKELERQRELIMPAVKETAEINKNQLPAVKELVKERLDEYEEMLVTRRDVLRDLIGGNLENINDYRVPSRETVRTQKAGKGYQTTRTPNFMTP